MRKIWHTLAIGTLAVLWALQAGAALPPSVSEALAKAGVSADNVSMLVTPVNQPSSSAKGFKIIVMC